MIERQIVSEKLKEKQIEDFVFDSLGRMSCSHVKMQRTPLGEKIIVYTSRPGMIVGRKGANIKMITEMLKKRFGMENPQIEVEEITDASIDAASVARTLIAGFQKFGPKRFKAMAYRALDESIKAGALGIEVVISGRGVPGERAKMWRFSAGYLKKSGDVAASVVDRCYENCNLKSGTIGIKVSILHPDVVLPDKMKMKVVAAEEAGEKAESKEGSGEEGSVLKELEAKKKKRSRKKSEGNEDKTAEEKSKEKKTRARKKKADEVKEEASEGKKDEKADEAELKTGDAESQGKTEETAENGDGGSEE